MKKQQKIKTCKGECHEKQNRKTIAEFLMAVLLLLCEVPVVSFAADLSGGTESAGVVSESDVSTEDVSEGDVSEGDVTAGDMTAGDALEGDVTDGNAEWEIPEMNYAGEIPVSDYETLKRHWKQMRPTGLSSQKILIISVRRADGSMQLILRQEIIP